MLAGVDHHRAFYAGHIFLSGQGFRDKGLKFGEIPGDAFQQKIDFARQHVALAYKGPDSDSLFEMLQIGIVLTQETDKDKACNLES